MSHLTDVESLAAAYEFTTLTTVVCRTSEDDILPLLTDYTARDNGNERHFDTSPGCSL